MFVYTHRSDVDQSWVWSPVVTTQFLTVTVGVWNPTIVQAATIEGVLTKTFRHYFFFFFTNIFKTWDELMMSLTFCARNLCRYLPLVRPSALSTYRGPLIAAKTWNRVCTANYFQGVRRKFYFLFFRCVFMVVAITLLPTAGLRYRNYLVFFVARFLSCHT